MQTLDTEMLSEQDIEELEKLIEGQQSPQLREFLSALSESLKKHEAIAAYDPDAELSPSQAATRLKMSRTHLYKLLDTGEIPSRKVGRDRRIREADLIEFERVRDRDRRELAERFARQDHTRSRAVDEISDLL